MCVKMCYIKNYIANYVVELKEIVTTQYADFSSIVPPTAIHSGHADMYEVAKRITLYECIAIRL